MTMPRVTWRSVATLLIAVTLWGFAPVGNRYLVTRYDPLGVLALRFTLASIAFLPMLRGLRSCDWSFRHVRLLIISGVVGILGYNLPVTIGQQTTSAGMAGLIIASEPIWILLLWCLIRRRWPDLRASCGAAIGLAGIALIISTAQAGEFAAGQGYLGPLLVLLAAIAWSLYCVLMRDVSTAFGAVRATALTIQIGTLPMLLAGAVPAWHLMAVLPAQDWLILLAMTLGSTVIAVLLWNQASAEIGATRAGPFLYLVPLVSIAGGVIALSERPHLAVLVGGGVVLLGVVIASTQPRARRS
jgi:drug/metabolite transporter (DMT)-like permease